MSTQGLRFLPWAEKRRKALQLVSAILSWKCLAEFKFTAFQQAFSGGFGPYFFLTCTLGKDTGDIDVKAALKETSTLETN